MKFSGLSFRLPLSLVAAAMLGACGGSTEDTQPQVELGDEELVNADINALGGNAAAEWWKIRKALSKYRDYKVAEAEGYINTQFCEANESGAMGIHFFKPELTMDLTSDPYKPEALLYVPNDEGGFTLLGVEYYQVEAGQAAPSVVGQQFDGPMDGHSPGEPVHYDLHVFLYKHNPAGLFAAYNPTAKCPTP